MSRRCVSFLTSRFCCAARRQIASTSTPGGSTMRQRPTPSDTPSAPISGSAARSCRSSPVTSSSTKRAVRPPLFLEIAVMDDRAVLHDHRLVAHLLDVAQQVGADEHVHALLVLHLGDELEHAPAGGRIEAVGGFVEHDQLRSVHDRLGELGHLLHAERVGPQLAIARFAEPDVEQHLVGLLERGFRRKPGELGHLAHEGDRRHVADERVVLRHVADARARFAHAVRAVDTENARAPGAGAQEPEQRQDQRGLARAVRSQQAHRFARAGHAEAAGDPVKDLPPPQFDFQVLELDDRDRVHASHLCLNAVRRPTFVPVSPGSGCRASSRR